MSLRLGTCGCASHRPTSPPAAVSICSSKTRRATQCSITGDGGVNTAARIATQGFSPSSSYERQNVAVARPDSGLEVCHPTLYRGLGSNRGDGGRRSGTARSKGGIRVQSQLRGAGGGGSKLSLEDWKRKLPAKRKALYSHSLPCIEAWLQSLGFAQGVEDRAVWNIERSDWHAQLSLDVTDLHIRYLRKGPGKLERDVERKFSYALSREDLENAILGGP